MAIAVVGLLVVVAAWLATSNPDYSCQQGLWPDLQGTNAVFEGGVGHWSWAPVGLVCDFPTTSGGHLVTTPNPFLSIVLVIALVAMVLAIALLIVRAAELRTQHSKQRMKQQ
ncbi:MAG: hypothetical protein ABIP33_10820 [Pseudolysinimonas sp.]